MSDEILVLSVFNLEILRNLFYLGFFLFESRRGSIVFTLTKKLDPVAQLKQKANRSHDSPEKYM